MVSPHAVDADQIMRFAFLGRERRLMTKYIRKGKASLKTLCTASDDFLLRYVEMLEQQQTQLVNGLQELYRRLTTGQEWEGPLLDDGDNGRPLTHDILSGLGVLHYESGSPSEAFEDDLEALQHRLLDDGTQPPRRTHSPDSEEEAVSNNNCFLDLQPDRPFQLSNIQLASRQTYPPNAQNLYSNRSWPGLTTSAPLGPPIQQHPIFPSPSNVKPSPNPMSLNPQSWIDSPMSYGDNGSFLPISGFSTLEDITTNRTSISPLAMDTDLPVTMAPTWTEDDFNKFLNSTLGQ